MDGLARDATSLARAEHRQQQRRRQQLAMAPCGSCVQARVGGSFFALSAGCWIVLALADAHSKLQYPSSEQQTLARRQGRNLANGWLRISSHCVPARAQ
jgi:hypothetical protein